MRRLPFSRPSWPQVRCRSKTFASGLRTKNTSRRPWRRPRQPFESRPPPLAVSGSGLYREEEEEIPPPLLLESTRGETAEELPPPRPPKEGLLLDAHLPL